MILIEKATTTNSQDTKDRLVNADIIVTALYTLVYMFQNYNFVLKVIYLFIHMK